MKGNQTKDLLNYDFFSKASRSLIPSSNRQSIDQKIPRMKEQTKRLVSSQEINESSDSSTQNQKKTMRVRTKQNHKPQKTNYAKTKHDIKRESFQKGPKWKKSKTQNLEYNDFKRQSFHLSFKKDFRLPDYTNSKRFSDSLKFDDPRRLSLNTGLIQGIKGQVHNFRKSRNQNKMVLDK